MAISSKMERMLSVVPEHIHDRSGIFMGSENEIKKVIEVFEKINGEKNVTPIPLPKPIHGK